MLAGEPWRRPEPWRLQRKTPQRNNLSTYRTISHDDCATCPAAHIPLLAAGMLTRRELCLTHFRLAGFDARAVIYNMGDAGEALFILRRGLLKLVRYSPDGGERIVRLLRPGDSFGFESLLGRPYQHQAVAATNCEICRMPAETIMAYGNGNMEVLQSLLAQYENSVATADTFLAELSTGNAHVRVARLLLFLANHDNESETPLLSREDMGAILGITTETASRVVADLRRKGLIELTGEHHCRCHPEGLVGIATR